MEDITVRTEWDPSSDDVGRSKAKVAGLLGLLVLAAGTVTWLLLRNDRGAKKLVRKLPKLRQALRRVSDHPERVARNNPGALGKILTSAGTAAASIVVKKAAGRVFDRYVTGVRTTAAPGR